jgi:hypothetical protein
MIAADFVDRQELHQFEPDPCGPIDELPERFHVPDAEVVLRPQRKQRREHSRDFSFGREIHEEKMTIGE